METTRRSVAACVVTALSCSVVAACEGESGAGIAHDRVTLPPRHGMTALSKQQRKTTPLRWRLCAQDPTVPY